MANTNDLVIAENMNADQERMLAEALGLVPNDNEGGNFIPQLKVNLDDEDADGNELKRGTYFIAGSGIERVYASKVTLRPLAQYFQWRRFDADLGKVTGRTIQVAHMSEEARDTDGTVKLGKPTWKQMQENPDLKEKFKDVTCFRMVYGLVSYTGKTAEGEESTIENQLVLFNLKGSNFSAFEDEVMKQIPKGHFPYNVDVEISNTRHKNGSVVYFVHKYKVLDTIKPLTPEVLESIKEVISMVKEENKYIEGEHTKALRQMADDSHPAMKTIEASYHDVMADLDDDLPASLKG